MEKRKKNENSNMASLNYKKKENKFEYRKLLKLN